MNSLRALQCGVADGAQADVASGIGTHNHLLPDARLGLKQGMQGTAYDSQLIGKETCIDQLLNLPVHRTDSFHLAFLSSSGMIVA